MASGSAQRWTPQLGSRFDDLDGSLAADFEGSLSGLGVELGAEHYNMSEALLALPVFHKKDDGEHETHILHLPHVYKQDHAPSPQLQYILCSCTSPATKLNEETLTYLNQGQSYEIKLKCRNNAEMKLVKSVIRVSFHEKRLQYMEQEQMNAWSALRKGERMLDIDIPLSYGIMDIHMDPHQLNAVEFLWDPSKDSAGVFLKVNSISTEFTPRKHGGEKGVPFRIQIETYTDGDASHIINCASCQVKVFKPKGADRKNRTDREKMEKRAPTDKEKFQPSYECTVLTEIPIEQVLAAQEQQKQAFLNYRSTTNRTTTPSTPVFISQTAISLNEDSHSTSPSLNGSYVPTQNDSFCEGLALPPDATAKDVAQWLHQNRFTSYVRIFQNFSGADLRKLTRDDLIQICGLADGIRLNNALTLKSVRPRLTMYVCQESEHVYHAIYLETLAVDELLNKLAQLFNVGRQKIVDLYFQGPNAIHVLVTDEVVSNIQDESRFIIEAQHEDQNSDTYSIVLKLIT